MSEINWVKSRISFIPNIFEIATNIFRKMTKIMKRLLKSLAKYICAVNLYFVLYKMIVEKDIYLNNSYAPACLYSLIKYTNENRKKR